MKRDLSKRRAAATPDMPPASNPRSPLSRMPPLASRLAPTSGGTPPSRRDRQNLTACRCPNPVKDRPPRACTGAGKRQIQNAVVGDPSRPPGAVRPRRPFPETPASRHRVGITRPPLPTGAIRCGFPGLANLIRRGLQVSRPCSLRSSARKKKTAWPRPFPSSDTLFLFAPSPDTRPLWIGTVGEKTTKTG